MDSSWWVIEQMDSPGSCWVWNELVVLSTDICGVLVAEIPPLPLLTSTLTETLEDVAPTPTSGYCAQFTNQKDCDTHANQGCQWNVTYCSSS
ncbi:MAG: hypothetical protein AB1345_09370 [Chloroflexota bacterium]